MRSPALRVSRRILGIDPNDPSLVLYLPFYYTGLQGSSFKSIDLGRYTCTVTGALWTSQGRTFDGDDRIACGTASVLNFGLNQDFAIELWLKRGAVLTTGGIISKMNAAETAGWDLWIHVNDTLRLTIADADGSSAVAFTSAIIETTTFHHIVINVDRIGGTFDCYLDLVKNSQASARPKDLTGVTPLYIGWGQNAAYGVNTTGEVRIYNHLLTLGEIRYNNLVTKWRYQ